MVIAVQNPIKFDLQHFSFIVIVFTHESLVGIFSCSFLSHMIDCFRDFDTTLPTLCVCVSLDTQCDVECITLLAAVFTHYSNPAPQKLFSPLGS